ncbi:MAG: DUF3560 domain-containing protein [Chloroflexi bacterium]|nr:DUF3560 domain-containing protein [Chloroflexota bacterium]
MPTQTTHSQRPRQPGARTHQILVIGDDGTYRRIDAPDQPLTLEVMQGLVDGLIERVSTAGFDVWLNEAGLLRESFGLNIAASWLLHEHGASGHEIYGPAFLARVEGEESHPLPVAQVQQLVDVIETLGWENQHEVIPIAGGSGEEVEEPPSRFFQCWPMAAYFADLAEESWDQTNGNYNVDEDLFEACCVGAHLAYFLGTKLHDRGARSEHHDFIDGIRAFADKLGIEHWQLNHVLYAGGAQSDPFGSKQWHVPPAVVFANLLSIEKVPDFETAEAMHLDALVAYAKTLLQYDGEIFVDPEYPTELSMFRCRGPWTGVCEVCEDQRLASTDVAFYDSREWLDHLVNDPVPMRTPIAGGSIEASCIGRARCIVQKDHEHCWAHEPACHAAFCHCQDSTPTTEQAYAEQLREETRPPARPIAGGSDVGTTTAVDVRCDQCTSTWQIEAGDALTCPICGTAEHSVMRLGPLASEALRIAGEEARLLFYKRTVGGPPIEGGSGAEEPLPLVFPTDSSDETPTKHQFSVETVERIDAERRWFVIASSEAEIRAEEGDAEWEEVVKEHGEDLIEQTILEITHFDDCEACEELPLIAGGATAAPKLLWETHGRGGLREYTSGNYAIFHPYPEELEKHGRGPLRLSRRWRVVFEDRHYTKEHGWVGPSTKLGTFDTLSEAKACAQRHADERATGQMELKPIAGGSGEEPPPRLTTRERKERRLYRREDWADSRRRKLDSARQEYDQRLQELPPMGEPIHVGHHSERRHRNAIKRLDRAFDKIGEHSQMLERHESKAAGIRHQLDVSIYDDDDDAIEQLQLRIAELEAQRDRMKAINAWFAKHGGIPKRRVPRGSSRELFERAADAIKRAHAELHFTDKEGQDLVRALEFNDVVGYPPYALSNLGGNIRRQVKRLERLRKEAGDASKP